MTTDVQDIKYKIRAITNDNATISLGRYFQGGDINYAANAVPSAEFKFSDKNETLSNGLLSPTTTFYIDFSASTDSGETYNKLFSGYVEDYSEELSPDGTQNITILAYDAPSIRYNYATPNQICMGDCDFGPLMTGTISASDGTSWNSDSKGNYPNGLLYDTDFSLSTDSVTNLFVGEHDVPLRLSYNLGRKLEIIKTWIEPYGLNFWLNTIDNTFHLVTSSRISPFVFGGNDRNLIIGTNINSMKQTKNLSKRSDAFSVIGNNNSVHHTYGTGTIESLSQESDIYSYEAAYNLAKRRYQLSTGTENSWIIQIPPISENYVGTSLHIFDKTGNAKLLYGSVLEQQHNFSSDRWDTQLTLENKRITEAKTLLQTREELIKQKEDKLSGVVYLRASSGESIWHSLSSASPGNICAIGFGHTFDTNSTGSYKTNSGIGEPMIIKPLDDYISVSIYTHSAYCTLNPSEANGLIREIVLFANTNSNNNLNSISETISWDREEGAWNNESSSSPYRALITSSYRYLVKVDSINILAPGFGEICYPMIPLDATVKYITDLAVNSLIPATLTDADGRIWNNRGRLFDSAQLTTMSKDLIGETQTFSCISVSNTAGDGTSTECPIQIIFEYQVPVDPPERAREITTGIMYHLIGYGMAKHSSFTSSRTMSCYMWKSASGAGTWSWVNYDNINQTYSSRSAYAFSTAPNPETQYYVDDKGTVRFGIFIDTMSTPYNDATLTAYLEYQGMNMTMKEQESSSEVRHEVTYFEKCPVNLFTGEIAHSFPARDILGIYASATSDGSGNYTEIEGATNLLFSHAYSGIERFNIFREIPDVERVRIHTRPGLRPRYRTQHLTPGELKTQENYLKYFIAPGKDPYLYAAYCSIVDNKHAFVKYRGLYYTPGVSYPDDLNIDMVSTSFVSESRGSQSIIYLDMNGAPMYGCDLKINYWAVGNDSATDEYGGTIGKAVFNMNTNSSLREGFDKTPFKTCFVQFDYNGDTTDDMGDAGGGGGGKYHPPIPV